MHCSVCHAIFQEKKDFQIHLTTSGHRTGQTKTQPPMPVLPQTGIAPMNLVPVAAMSLPMDLAPMGAAHGGKVKGPKKLSDRPKKGSHNKKTQVVAYEKKQVVHERIEGKIIKKKQKTMEAFILLDTSGSMAGTKLAEAQTGAIELFGAFADSDLLTLVQFASDVKICQGSKATIVGHIKEMKADGATMLNSAVISALERMRPDLHSVQIIILTDGAATDVDNAARLFHLLDENKDKRNVRITLIQVGIDVRTSLEMKISALKAKNMAVQNVGYTLGAIKNVLSEMKANVITKIKTIACETVKAKHETAGADMAAMGTIGAIGLVRQALVMPPSMPPSMATTIPQIMAPTTPSIALMDCASRRRGFVA